MGKNLTIDGRELTDVTAIKALETGTNQYASFVDTSDANAVASDIMEGKTAYVNGNKVTGTSAGEKPTLFAPTITSGINTIAWENNALNGGFPVTISASIEGLTVTSPLTITTAMDEKTLRIIANSENFKSVITEVSLAYLPDLPNTQWQFNDIITDDQLKAGREYEFSGDVVSEDGVLRALRVFGSATWEDFITIYSGTQTSVFYYPQYGWYIRTGTGNRNIIPAPILNIYSLSAHLQQTKPELAEFTRWLKSNATQIS